MKKFGYSTIGLYYKTGEGYFLNTRSNFECWDSVRFSRKVQLAYDFDPDYYAPWAELTAYVYKIPGNKELFYTPFFLCPMDARAYAYEAGATDATIRKNCIKAKLWSTNGLVVDPEFVGKMYQRLGHVHYVEVSHGDDFPSVWLRDIETAEQYQALFTALIGRGTHFFPEYLKTQPVETRRELRSYLTMLKHELYEKERNDLNLVYNKFKLAKNFVDYMKVRSADEDEANFYTNGWDTEFDWPDGTYSFVGIRQIQSFD